MSKLDDEIALLRMIDDAGGLLVIEHGRYRKRKQHGSFSDNLARRLAVDGLIEVESRTCSPWGFGPKVVYATSAGHPKAYQDYQDQKAAREAFIARNPPQFQGRTDLALRLTEDGREYLRRYG